MKIDKIKVYLVEFILLAILSFALFVPNIFTRIVLSIVLVIGAIVTWLMMSKRNVPSVHSKKVTILLAFFAVIYLAGFYLMGLYFGYYEAMLKFNWWTTWNFIIPTAFIIIASEVIRNILLAQKSKISRVATFVIMVLIDLILYVNIYTMDSLEKFAEIVGFSFFASIACNLLYDYTSSRYGIIGNIVYRLITILYMYIIPYIPNVFIFFRSVLRMVYPYVIYHILEYTFATKKATIAVEDKRKNIISKVILGVFAVVLVMLISCQFQYGVLVIGSGSMTGTLNKGSAVIFESYDKQEHIPAGQIILFYKDGVKIVHRITDVKSVNGEVRYTTKGDANQQEDEGYITKEDIFGVCKLYIPYIGYPSLWLNDIFSN